MTDFDIRAVLGGTLTRMHRVQRYSSVPVLRPENVAEHSWQVAMICYAIGTDVNARSVVSIDIGALLVKALTHDVSEALSGDIIRSFKHSSPALKKAIEDADAINMAKLRTEIGQPVGQDLYVAWSEAKDDTLEGDIVGLADLLCVVSYCIEEYALGNRRILFIAERMYKENLFMWHTHNYLGRYVDALYPHGDWQDIFAINLEAH